MHLCVVSKPLPNSVPFCIVSVSFFTVLPSSLFLHLHAVTFPVTCMFLFFVFIMRCPCGKHFFIFLVQLGQTVYLYVGLSLTIHQWGDCDSKANNRSFPRKVELKWNLQNLRQHLRQSKHRTNWRTFKYRCSEQLRDTDTTRTIQSTKDAYSKQDVTTDYIKYHGNKENSRKRSTVRHTHTLYIYIYIYIYAYIHTYIYIYVHPTENAENNILKDYIIHTHTTEIDHIPNGTLLSINFLIIFSVCKICERWLLALSGLSVRPSAGTCAIFLLYGEYLTYILRTTISEYCFYAQWWITL